MNIAETEIVMSESYGDDFARRFSNTAHFFLDDETDPVL
jgi:hypothetical protein